VPSSFVTGNRTFNSFYGLNHRFPYFIQDQLGNWEKGRGFLSASTTLVRETVIDNSLSTAALIDFPAGDKLVMVPTDAGLFWPETLDSGSFITSAGQIGFANTGRSLTANRVNLSNFIAARPMAVTGFTFEVTTAAASSMVKPVIYKARNQSSGNMVVDLVAVGTAIDSSTLGRKSSSVTASIGQGYYMVGFVSNGAPVIRGNDAAQMYVGLDVGLATTIIPSVEYPISAGSYDNPPATISATPSSGGSAFRVGLQGRYL
jgi:hypothetical protein